MVTFIKTSLCVCPVLEDKSMEAKKKILVDPEFSQGSSEFLQTFSGGRE